MINLPEWIG